ncbi:FkbM family methyltransferase [Salinarimonas sp.]|uniref:FkbM family methyltransferase n=1 Tax=Salinarimonas sp. TaxID=2766526 RepID=UPI0032D936CB
MMRSTLKRLVEATLNVKIYRKPPSKHFYPTLATMRRWSEADIVFDVGANDGRTVQLLQTYLPSPRIFAFEPVSETFGVLRDRMSGLRNVSVHPYALGDVAGEAEINLHELSTHNSLITDSPSGGGRETVRIETVDRVMREFDVGFVHFLKIDTEGYELQVLQGAADALGAARIGIVQAEFHLNAEEGLQRIHDFLGPFGYELVGLYNQCHCGTEFAHDWRYASTAGYSPHRLSYADAVYIYTGNKRSPQPALM